MKRLTVALSMTVLVCFLGGSLAVARQTGQAAPPKSGDKSASELANEGMAAYQKKDYGLAAKLL